jgi:hypothetical protein
MIAGPGNLSHQHIILLILFVKSVITLNRKSKSEPKRPKTLRLDPSTTTLRHHPSKTNISRRNPPSPKLPHTRLVNRSILLPPRALKPTRSILGKSEPRILHNVASLVLGLCRLAPEIRVRAEQHRQLCAVVGAEPGRGRDVCEVAGVLVAVSGEAGLLAQAAGFRDWAEEGREQGGFGEGWVWAGRLVGGEGHAVLRVGADYGGLVWSVSGFDQVG